MKGTRLSEKGDLGPQATSPALLLLGPVETLPLQKGLDRRSLTVVAHVPDVSYCDGC